MKKFFYSALALAAIFTVSCNKEADVLSPAKISRIDISGLPTHTESFSAEFGSGLTRTDYEGKTFTWIEQDSIYVQVQSEPDADGSFSFGFATFYAQSTGASVDFVGEVPDGYTTATPAFYIATNASLDLGVDEQEAFDGDYYVQIPGYTTIGADAKQGYYAADPNKPLANMPLFGTKQEDGSFQFTSMTGALKLTLTGLDAQAAIVQIYNSENKLSGDFKVSEAGVLEMANAREGTYTYNGRDYNYSNYYAVTDFAQEVSDGAVTVYIPVPVGTLPAGTTLYIHDSDLNILYSRTFSKAVTIARNTVTELAPLKAGYEIETLGTGKFYDRIGWALMGVSSTDYVDVEISRDAASGKIFIESPYGAAAEAFGYVPDGEVDDPDEQLILEVDAEGNVNYDAHIMGIYISNWDDGVAISDPYWYSLNYPQYYADFYRGNNFVAKYASDGETPANIILSPVYAAVETSWWYGDSFIWSNPIQIVLPGSEPVDINYTANYSGVADASAKTVKFDVTLGSDLAALKLVIADTREAALAAFASGTGVTTVSASGTAVVALPAGAGSGAYKAFAQVQVKSGLAASANYVNEAAEFNYEDASEYETIGTGKYYDDLAWYYMGGSEGTYVDVEIRKHKTEKKYIIVNPYGAAASQFNYSPEGTVGGPDAELVLTVDEDDIVSYPSNPSYRTGIYMSAWNSGSGDELCITPPAYYSENYASYYADFEKGNNFVARYDANGVPTNIIMSPVYDGVVSNTWNPNYIWLNPIEVIFPGSASIDLSAEAVYAGVVDDNPAQAVASVNIVLGSDVQSASVVIATSKETALAALSAGTGVTVVTATGPASVNFPANAPSGKYAVYARIQAKAGFTEAANVLAFSEQFNYFNIEDDKGYTLDDIIGTYSASSTYIYTGTWTRYSSVTMKIAESDDPMSGDVMITSFAPEFMDRYGTNTPIANVGGVYGWFNTQTGEVSFPDGQEFLYNASNRVNWLLENYFNEGSDILFLLEESGVLTTEDAIGLAVSTYGTQGILDYPETFTRTSKSTAPAANSAYGQAGSAKVKSAVQGPAASFSAGKKQTASSRR